ncbi:MAG: porphobilinogen synthase [Eubacteriales bacterium]|nr:porphobilinogen synthase [Eubacteriales bacterium]
MIYHGRRLRRNELLRELKRESRFSKDDLIYPIFIEFGQKKKLPIGAMPGQYRYSIDLLPELIEQKMEAGVKKFLLFGIPEKKDELGSGAYAEDGIIQSAARALKARYGSEILLISDLCMCEYTSHGHCGILSGAEVDNAKTLPYLAEIALSQAAAGCDIVAPSDMMDARVKIIREKLDASGFKHIPIMSYAVKYASVFYGPFREAADSAPQFGDRKAYQMDPHNRREAILEAQSDLAEGADILIIKPALSYLDVVRELAAQVNVPLCCYSVSGEYAMVEAAAAKGYIDRERMIEEIAVSCFRAGANLLISYHAEEIAAAISAGRIS